MTRRSPPSHLNLLPSHLPTPPRGAPKFSLPSLPQGLPTITHRRCRSVSSVSSLHEILSSPVTITFPIPSIDGDAARHVEHSYINTITNTNTNRNLNTNLSTDVKSMPEREAYRPAEEGTKPPWVRSRGFDVADAELGWGKGVKVPQGAMVSERE
ncbi:hypothetical protein IAU59_006637 [Kwoniella sp. CBS 9459]